MSENFRNAVLLFFEAIHRGNPEEISQARLTVFNIAMNELAEEDNEEDNIELDLDLMRQSLDAPADAPIMKLYKMFIAGFNAGLNAMTALLEGNK